MLLEMVRQRSPLINIQQQQPSDGSSGGHNRKDPAWRHGTQVQSPNRKGKFYVYKLCNYCGKKVTGGVKRMKDYLAGNHKNVVACEKVPSDVKEEITAYLKEQEDKKRATEENFEIIVQSGRYFEREDVGSNVGRNASVTSSRGVTGDLWFTMNMMA
ncbi:hypothetical protein Sjap_014988 [Stephania japonica]|uniref:BED-type domain-containing protein n=1 Tax=Stephania japonica TaxID=461633 RepID=A0AAP0IJS7_9MAGN